MHIGVFMIWSQTIEDEAVLTRWVRRERPSHNSNDHEHLLSYKERLICKDCVVIAVHMWDRTNLERCKAEVLNYSR
jgi:hypothetical protein